MTSGGFVLSERENEAAGPAGHWGNVPDGMSESKPDEPLQVCPVPKLFR